MKTVFLGVFILFLLLLNSCGFFKSTGLYNIPPDYAETFEEINGTPFIDHPNLTSNIVLELTPTQKVFSPYDSIKLILRVINLSSTDTMYISKPKIYNSDILNQKLVVKDSTNKTQRIFEHYTNIDFAIRRDDYGRKVSGTIGHYGEKISPLSTQNYFFSIKTGEKILPPLFWLVNFIRENRPGNYYSFYYQRHEEYDNIKGPVYTKLTSDTALYSIRPYTDEETIIRNEAKDLVSKIDSTQNLEYADNWLSAFNKRYPENPYKTGMIDFLNLKKDLKKYENEKKLK